MPQNPSYLSRLLNSAHLAALKPEVREARGNKRETFGEIFADMRAGIAKSLLKSPEELARQREARVARISANNELTIALSAAKADRAAQKAAAKESRSAAKADRAAQKAAAKESRRAAKADRDAQKADPKTSEIIRIDQIFILKPNQGLEITMGREILTAQMYVSEDGNATLEIYRTNGQRIHTLRHDRVVDIGRGKDFPDLDASISRKHASISFNYDPQTKMGIIHVEDLGSSNGTDARAIEISEEEAEKRRMQSETTPDDVPAFNTDNDGDDDPDEPQEVPEEAPGREPLASGAIPEDRFKNIWDPSHRFLTLNTGRPVQNRAEEKPWFQFDLETNGRRIKLQLGGDGINEGSHLMQEGNDLFISKVKNPQSATPELFVKFFDEEQQREERYKIPKNQTVFVGRDPENTQKPTDKTISKNPGFIKIDDRRLSRRHLAIKLGNDGKLYVKDLHSRYGTRLIESY